MIDESLTSSLHNCWCLTTIQMSPTGQSNRHILLGLLFNAKMGLTNRGTSGREHGFFHWWSCHGEFNPPHKPIMFEGYANEVILPSIKSQVSKFWGLTSYLMLTLRIVCLKSQTRKQRWTGIRQKFVGLDITPKSWNNVLLVSENKT